MFYPDDTKQLLEFEKSYFINFSRKEQYLWYARIQENIGHDSSEYNFDDIDDLKIWNIMLSGDQHLIVEHEDDKYIIYRSIDTGIVVDIFLNKETGQFQTLEVYDDAEDSINL